MNDPIIAVDELTKYYGRAVGIERISFHVNPGEVFGFLGPNGAGKTTTIRLLLDLLRPSSGAVSVFGLPVRTHSCEIRRRCGYLPGDFAGYGQLTGAEFLRFAAEMRRSKPLLQDRLLDRFKVGRQDLAKKIKYISHGTRQKLGVVQAFVHDPELIILDEPTSGLDPLMQEEFYALVRDTCARGRTVFFSSHNLPEVEKICGRVAIVRNGGLVALETLDALKRKRYRRMIVTLDTDVPGMHVAGTELQRRQGLRRSFAIWRRSRWPISCFRKRIWKRYS
jgi:ABC-2 type transport system ATP-binding protein